MNAARTRALDHAPLPTARAADLNQRFSKMSADAPESDATTHVSVRRDNRRGQYAGTAANRRGNPIRPPSLPR